MQCEYVNADGSGGSEIYIGVEASQSACTAACFKRKISNPLINGATFSHSFNKKCYCEIGQNGQKISSKWRNCWFNKPFVPPESKWKII